MKKALRGIAALATALLLFSQASVGASVMNLIIDDRESMIVALDNGISDAFNNGENEIQFIMTGGFVGQFKAVDGGFEPEERYFMSTDPMLKYKYTAGNDYIGLKMNEVRAEVKFTYDQRTNIVNEFDVVYKVAEWHETPEETEFVDRFVADNIGTVLAGAQTEYDKAKNIHDYIVLNFDYAYSDTYNAKSHSAYGMLTNGRGVCSAYTLLFHKLARAAGLEVRIVFSEETYAVTGSSFSLHCWNMVVVDGVWYHVDVTWDDQPHLKGGIVYNFFLKSSDFFLKNSHLWDDRTDGVGTPYPTAPKNHGGAPGPSYNDNITRPTEGDKPAVVENVTGTESSVPEVVELSSSSEASAESSDESAADGTASRFSENRTMYIVCGAVVAAAFVALAVIIAVKSLRPKYRSRKKKEKEAPAVSQPAESARKDGVNGDMRDSRDSFDSYDGFDF